MVLSLALEIWIVLAPFGNRIGDVVAGSTSVCLVPFHTVSKKSRPVLEIDVPLQTVPRRRLKTVETQTFRLVNQFGTTLNCLARFESLVPGVILRGLVAIPKARV
jgi:hypothetical protein